MAVKKSSKKDLIIYGLICISVIVIIILFDRFYVFNKLEYGTQDFRFRIRGIENTSDKIVIVAIDSQTLATFGLKGVPPRSFHPQLIENLYKAGAKAVLFDVLFFGYTGETNQDQILPSPSHQDSMLAESLFMYSNTTIARKIKKEIQDATSQTAGEPPLPAELFQNPNQLAFVDMIPDEDSFVRRARLFSKDFGTNKGWQYSLGLKAAMYALDADTAWVDEKKNIIHIANRNIQLESTLPPSMIINYSIDEKTFAENNNYISYVQVWDTSETGIDLLIKNKRLKDKVVLVGATFPESKDWEKTPFYLGTSIFNNKNEYPMYGVHIHKQIADTIINNRFIGQSSDIQFILLIILMAIISTLINYRFRGFLGLFLCASAIIIYSGISIYLFISNRFLVPVIAPAFATVMLNYISVVTYNYLTERKQKTLIKGIFSRYVPGSVVNEILKNPESIKLGGEERIMSVIFSDVAGFTTISEKLSPTQLVELLNEYLTAMTDIIFKYNGIIDKYEGDAIMAEFGAPLADENHALNACITAIEMQAKLQELRTKLKSEGRPELFSRVGINSGAMVKIGRAHV
jgi:adenylate cyclase